MPARAKRRWSGRQRAGAGAPDVGAALRRERLALAAALGDRRPRRGLPARPGDGGTVRLRRPGARCRHRRRDPASARAMSSRRALPPWRSASRARASSNYSSDIDPILLYDPEVLPRRAARRAGRSGAAGRAQRGRDALRRRITKAMSSASICGCGPASGSVAAGDFASMRRCRITKARRWRGSGRRSSGRGRRRAISRRARTSCARSAPSCGARTSISGRSRKSAG